MDISLIIGIIIFVIITGYLKIKYGKDFFKGPHDRF